jgi:hypothetical protein
MGRKQKRSRREGRKKGRGGVVRGKGRERRGEEIGSR